MKRGSGFLTKVIVKVNRWKAIGGVGRISRLGVGCFNPWRV